MMRVGLLRYSIVLIRGPSQNLLGVRLADGQDSHEPCIGRNWPVIQKVGGAQPTNWRHRMKTVVRSTISCCLIGILCAGCRPSTKSEPVYVATALNAASFDAPTSPRDVLVTPIGLRLRDHDHLSVDVAVEGPNDNVITPDQLPFLFYWETGSTVEIIYPNGRPVNLKSPKPTRGCYFGPPIQGYSMPVGEDRRRVFVVCEVPLSVFTSLERGTYRIRLLDNAAYHALGEDGICRIDTSWHELPLEAATLIRTDNTAETWR
jgi:hypothetical protein